MGKLVIAMYRLRPIQKIDCTQTGTRGVVALPWPVPVYVDVSRYLTTALSPVSLTTL